MCEKKLVDSTNLMLVLAFASQMLRFYIDFRLGRLGEVRYLPQTHYFKTHQLSKVAKIGL